MTIFSNLIRMLRLARMSTIINAISSNEYVTNKWKLNLPGRKNDSHAMPNMLENIVNNTLLLTSTSTLVCSSTSRKLAHKVAFAILCSMPTSFLVLLKSIINGSLCRMDAASENHFVGRTYRRDLIFQYPEITHTLCDEHRLTFYRVGMEAWVINMRFDFDFTNVKK